MILVVAVPRLGNVDLAVSWPLERLLREKPECRPDTRGARREDHGRQSAAVATQRLSAHQPRRSVLLLRVGGLVVGERPEHEQAIGRAVRKRRQPLWTMYKRSRLGRMLTRRHYWARQCSAEVLGCPSRRARCQSSHPIRRLRGCPAGTWVASTPGPRALLRVSAQAAVAGDLEEAGDHRRILVAAEVVGGPAAAVRAVVLNVPEGDGPEVPEVPGEVGNTGLAGEEAAGSIAAEAAVGSTARMVAAGRMVAVDTVDTVAVVVAVLGCFCP